MNIGNFNRGSILKNLLKNSENYRPCITVWSPLAFTLHATGDHRIIVVTIRLWRVASQCTPVWILPRQYKRHPGTLQCTSCFYSSVTSCLPQTFVWDNLRRTSGGRVYKRGIRKQRNMLFTVWLCFNSIPTHTVTHTHTHTDRQTGRHMKFMYQMHEQSEAMLYKTWELI